jgi:hypothetical protein
LRPEASISQLGSIGDDILDRRGNGLPRGDRGLIREVGQFGYTVAIKEVCEADGGGMWEGGRERYEVGQNHQLRIFADTPRLYIPALIPQSGDRTHSQRTSLVSQC